MNDLTSTLSSFQNEPNELLKYLCRNVHNELLEQISRADYGQDANRYLAELKLIKQNSRIHEMNFGAALSEVVELTKWKKPVPTKDNRITDAQKVNLAIAFSCTILLTVPSEWYGNRMGENSTIIRLIESSEYLQPVLPEILSKVSQLLAWRITENDTDLEEIPFFILGLILIILKSGEFQEAQVARLIEQLITVEQKEFEKMKEYYIPESNSWLMRLTSYDTLKSDWQSQQLFLIEQSKKTKNEALKTNLQQLAELLS